MGMGLGATAAVLASGTLAAGLLAGCVGQGSAGPSAGAAPGSATGLIPSTPRLAPSTATGTPPAPDSPRIGVRRTGGIAGVEQALAVQPDGAWSWAGADQGGGPRRGWLTEAQRAELARLAALPALAGEARRKPGPPQCADGFDYLLSVGSLTVAWVDCAPVRPPTAVAITDLLAAATPL
jgi:hypothetical protein